jgi:hypothetical protein
VRKNPGLPEGEAVKAFNAEPLDGDVIFVGSKSLLGWLIRRFQREHNDPAPYNHVGLIGKLTRDRWEYLNSCGETLPREWIGSLIVVEALIRISCTLLSDYVQRNDDMLIARETNLTADERASIFDGALDEVGLGYSIPKLLAYGVDKILGTNLAARTGSQEFVCSTVLARYFARVKRYFEGLKNIRAVKPDNIWDTVKAGHPWQILWRKDAR